MTKQIPLSQGKFAIVDDADYEWLNQWKWTADKSASSDTWYARRGEGRPSRKKSHMHRVIMNAPDGMEVDHVNGDGLDNRRENLRICTRAQNAHNTGIHPRNTTGFKGVSRTRQGFVAQMVINGKHIYIGTFKSPEEAAKAWDESAKKNHGEFARLNFQEGGVQ
jgi:hypothetical protein